MGGVRLLKMSAKEINMAFKDLDEKELYRTAVEDFAVDVKPDDKKEVLIAALKEDGVTWALYKKANPDVSVGDDDDDEDAVVKSEDVTGKKDKVVEGKVRTQAAPVDVTTVDSYLIKMDRDNPYFEHKGYKFTSEHPYVVMPAADADDILRREEGFSIATPSEAAEYYNR
jgi:hypothetical protein